MGMSSYVYGLVKPNEKHLNMLKVYQVCTEAGVELPDEVYDYFEGSEPDLRGMRFDIPEDAIDESCNQEAQEWITINLSEIDKRITHIRFVNSY